MMDFSLITDEPLDYCVYAHVNKLNGKMYIGITHDVKRRWATQGLHYKGCTKFNRAIQKYGWDSFDHIVLIDNISVTMACELEIQLIKKYDTINNGYNLTNGGTHGVYDRNIRIYQYDFDGNFIKKWDSTIDAIRAYGYGIQDNLSGRIKSAHGYLWSYEYVEKMQPYELTYDHNKIEFPQKEILAYNTNGTIFRKYNSYEDLDEKYDKRIIMALCERKREYIYYNLIWGYADWINTKFANNLVVNCNKEFNSISSKYPYKVKQYSLKGEYIQTFNSPFDVQNKLGFTYSVIQNVCLGKNHVGYGFLWRFSCDGLNVEPFIKSSHSGRAVLQKDLEGNFIKEYPSAMAAARLFSKSKKPNSTKIIDVCNGMRYSAYGFLWEYADQEVN